MTLTGKMQNRMLITQGEHRPRDFRPVARRSCSRLFYFAVAAATSNLHAGVLTDSASLGLTAWAGLVLRGLHVLPPPSLTPLEGALLSPKPAMTDPDLMLHHHLLLSGPPL